MITANQLEANSKKIQSKMQFISKSLYPKKDKKIYNESISLKNIGCTNVNAYTHIYDIVPAGCDS